MATESSTQVLADGAFNDGGRLWRAKPDATSTFEENVVARALFIDLHQDEFWNPWRFEEQAAELERAQQVMQEWERAEPNFKRKTKRQFDAEMARWDRDFRRKRTLREHGRQEHLKRFVDGAIERHRAAVERLTPVVGDSEDVPDQHGHLPRDRRHSTLYSYRERRIVEVREIHTQLPELERQIKETDDRETRSKLRAERDVKKWRLDKLLAVPRLEAEDMCADCATPASKHGYVSPPFDFPCPAWPGQRAIHEKTRQLLETFQRRRDAEVSNATPAPKPEPLAIVPSGLPITEVVQRLQELQTQHPDAEVRRGRANRWELWPPK